MLAFVTKSDMFLRKDSQVASKFSMLAPPHAVKVEIERAERRMKLRVLDFLIALASRLLPQRWVGKSFKIKQGWKATARPLHR